MPRTKADIEFIAIHCSATVPDWGDDQGGQWKVDEITRWHLAKGWRAIGYNEIIDRDGRVYKGRDLDNDGDLFEEVGAHVKGKNKIAYGVCLIGGHGSSENDKFQDHFTEEQNQTLRRRIREIRRDLGRQVPARGHNEFAAKACPGFKVHDWLNNRPGRTSPMQSTTVLSSGGGLATAVGAGGTAVASLEGNAQLVALVGLFLIVAFFLWIMRERIRSFAAGRR